MKEVYNTQRKSEKDAFHSELKNLERIKKIKYKKTYTQMFFLFFFLMKMLFCFCFFVVESESLSTFSLKITLKFVRLTQRQ